ncbi:helix-turn-helix domain-containing protein [Flavobacterium ardleyense]|uniref:helix-turn-helix domain-containing protein n=1 Tax=Flavobacterium ardleyense TaxID=2038737 RepID=UPI003872E3EB
MITDIYEFLLLNLNSPLPSLKNLAKKFATNEHKLKDGFKHFFQTSIYKFYNDEKLNRVHLLIQQTKLPLKNFADMSGFNLYSNFSKAFKKQFLYPPSQVKRFNYLKYTNYSR